MTPTFNAADPTVASQLRERIRRTAEGLGPVTLMEVCGTHTMAIARHGLKAFLPRSVRLVSGPGCPVCVTPVGYLDHARALARVPGVVIASFGDLVRVPGSSGSLESDGAPVEIVPSPLSALDLARRRPHDEVVFLAVGFETTIPTVAATILAAENEGIANFSVLCAHRTIPAALAALTDGLHLHGLLCPGHVSAVTGLDIYEPLSARGVACVVAGFEPLHILLAFAMLLDQLATGRSTVENAYRHVVRPEGNPRARALAAQVFEPCDATWRGLGMIPGSGLRLRPEHRSCDAASRFSVEIEPPVEPAGCLCGNILRGAASPRECPLFGSVCTPETPRGACMVSSEGTCAAAIRYGELEEI